MPADLVGLQVQEKTDPPESGSGTGRATTSRITRARADSRKAMLMLTMTMGRVFQRVITSRPAKIEDSFSGVFATIDKSQTVLLVRVLNTP